MQDSLILKALADDTRLEIIRYLLSGKRNVTKIVLHIKKSQPNTSLALRHLLLTGIVEQEKQGREVHYRIARPDKLVAMLELLEDIHK